MTQGAGFRICGTVKRVFVNQAGTFVALSLAVSAGGRTSNIDLKGFAEAAPAVIGIEAGDLVEVTGNVASEKLTAKDKSAVQVDGRDKWVPSLVIKAVKVDAKAKPKTTDEVLGGDDFGF